MKTEEELVKEVSNWYDDNYPSKEEVAKYAIKLGIKQGKHQFDNQIKAIKDVAEQVGFDKGVKQGKKIILKEVEELIDKYISTDLQGHPLPEVRVLREIKQELAKLQEKGK